MFKKIFQYFRKQKVLHTTNPNQAIREFGHRDYVGGKWDEIGRLQLDFLKAQGLLPSHVFLDIACGALRGGVHFIHYLERTHYLGIEKEKSLVDAGIEKELGLAIYKQKKPEIIISDSFEFQKLTKAPDYALAHALFTHLVPDTIHLCMKNLRNFVRPGCRFYSTFLETSTGAQNPEASQDHTLFYYTRLEMSAFGEKNGWQPHYIGDWKHPRKQVMIEYRAV